MPRVSDDVQSSQLNDVTCTGRASWPSEKVQAMLDEQQQEKQKQDQEATSKAKRREVSMHKREKASQAAKTDLCVPAAAMMQVDEAGMGPPGQIPIRQDNAFTVRSVVMPSAEHGNPRGALAPWLVLRRGNVPPVAGRTPVRPIHFRHVHASSHPPLGLLSSAIRECENGNLPTSPLSSWSVMSMTMNPLSRLAFISL
ncbi:hypothetical protein EDD15DRAFT_2365574 [Pisolithus albus]|nr:hypothetical protein EDD15DRAFT_2365574 [Pisolithus albus]